MIVEGPGTTTIKLEQPETRDGFYRDVRVLAFAIRPDMTPHEPLRNWRNKAMHEAISFSGPNGWFLTNSAPDTSARSRLFRRSFRPRRPGGSPT